MKVKHSQEQTWLENAILHTTHHSSSACQTGRQKANHHSEQKFWLRNVGFPKKGVLCSSTLHRSFLLIEGPVPPCLWTSTHFLRNVHGRTIFQPQACTFMLQSCTFPAPKSCLCFALSNREADSRKGPRILRNVWFGFTLYQTTGLLTTLCMHLCWHFWCPKCSWAVTDSSRAEQEATRWVFFSCKLHSEVNIK